MHHQRMSKIVAVSVMTAAAAFLLSACQQSGGGSGNSASPVAAASGGQVGAMVAGQLVSYTPGVYKPLSTCNLGMVNTTIFETQPVELRTGTVNTFKGWLFTTSLDSPRYWLRFDAQRDGRYLQSPLQLSVERPDVAALHPDAPRVSGFAVTIPTNALPPGRYHAYLAVTSGDTTYICDSGRHIDAIGGS